MHAFAAVGLGLERNLVDSVLNRGDSGASRQTLLNKLTDVLLYNLVCLASVNVTLIELQSCLSSHSTHNNRSFAVEVKSVALLAPTSLKIIS